MYFLSEAVCVHGVSVITPQCHHTTVLLGWCLRASACVLAAVLAQPWSCRAVDVQGLPLALCAAVAHWLRGKCVQHINHISTVGAKHKTETQKN